MARQLLWLCAGKNAHTILVETSKLLQGEICQSSIDNMTRPIMKNVSVVAVAFNIPVSCVYI